MAFFEEEVSVPSDIKVEEMAAQSSAFKES